MAATVRDIENILRARSGVFIERPRRDGDDPRLPARLPARARATSWRSRAGAACSWLPATLGDRGAKTPSLLDEPLATADVVVTKGSPTARWRDLGRQQGRGVALRAARPRRARRSPSSTTPSSSGATCCASRAMRPTSSASARRARLPRTSVERDRRRVRRPGHPHRRPLRHADGRRRRRAADASPPAAAPSSWGSCSAGCDRSGRRSAAFPSRRCGCSTPSASRCSSASSASTRGRRSSPDLRTTGPGLAGGRLHRCRHAARRRAAVRALRARA